jgi:hypothetical protein
VGSFVACTAALKVTLQAVDKSDDNRDDNDNKLIQVIEENIRKVAN